MVDDNKTKTTRDVLKNDCASNASRQALFALQWLRLLFLFFQRLARQQSARLDISLLKWRLLVRHTPINLRQRNKWLLEMSSFKARVPKTVAGYSLDILFPDRSLVPTGDT